MFETPTWLVDRAMWNKFNNPISADPIMSLQERTVNSIVSTDRLGRLQLSAERFGADKAYTAMELLNDVQGTIFNELSSKKAIDTYKRMLQRAYVDRLTTILNPSAPAGGGITISFGGGGPAPIDAKKSDVTAIVRAQLAGLRGQLNTAAATTADRMSKIHLADLAERIKQALDPK